MNDLICMLNLNRVYLDVTLWSLLDEDNITTVVALNIIWVLCAVLNPNCCAAVDADISRMIWLSGHLSNRFYRSTNYFHFASFLIYLYVLLHKYKNYIV